MAREGSGLVLARRLALIDARIQDPDRPLLSALFLGASGVGKTEMAKAVAELVLEHEDQLLRFDLNTCVTATAVERSRTGLRPGSVA